MGFSTMIIAGNCFGVIRLPVGRAATLPLVLMVMRDVEVYRLEVNGRLLARVIVEQPFWLPVRPTLSVRDTWLRHFICRALCLL